VPRDTTEYHYADLSHSAELTSERLLLSNIAGKSLFSFSSHTGVFEWVNKHSSKLVAVSCKTSSNLWPLAALFPEIMEIPKYLPKLRRILLQERVQFLHCNAWEIDPQE